jgi:phage terminase small subunit
MRGRKPLPVRLKLLRGNPGNRPLNTEEPQVNLVEGLPGPPKWLKSKYAKEEWAIQIEYLTRNGVLGQNEVSALADYCQLHGDFVEGVVSNHPMTAANIAQMRALRAELGIGPSARSRLKTGNASQEEVKEKRFFG